MSHHPRSRRRAGADADPVRPDAAPRWEERPGRRNGHQERSQRQLRVAERMRHLLAEHLLRGELHDPRLAGASLTVSEVRVSRDLRNATAFVAALGAEPGAETLAALNRAASHLGGWLAREMHLKHAPRLGFAVDGSFAHADRIERMLLAEAAQMPARDDDGGDADEPA